MHLHRRRARPPAGGSIRCVGKHGVNQSSGVGGEQRLDDCQSSLEIIEGVEETAKGISQIAEATTEQAQTAAEVNTGIQNISSITENNASAPEEMSGSAEELSGQALQLKELVNTFKIDDSINSGNPSA